MAPKPPKKLSRFGSLLSPRSRGQSYESAIASSGAPSGPPEVAASASDSELISMDAVGKAMDERPATPQTFGSAEVAAEAARPASKSIVIESTVAAGAGHLKQKGSPGVASSAIGAAKKGLGAVKPGGIGGALKKYTGGRAAA